MKVNHGLLTREIPGKLTLCSGLAADLRGTWSHTGDVVWETIAPLIGERTENPHVVLQHLSQERLEQLAPDANGWQQETYPCNDSTSLPVRPVQAKSGAWLYVTLYYPRRFTGYKRPNPLLHDPQRLTRLSSSLDRGPCRSSLQARPSPPMSRV